MITTSRFLGYDKNEYGDLIVNRKEAEIVSLTFDLYLLNVGSSRIGELLDYLGVKTVTGTTWESGTINGMLCNEKYKGDFHLQKYYTPENKRNHTRKNNGEVQSYYISENHEPIVSPEVWEKVQEVREQRKRDRNIGQDSTMKFQNRYPLSGMLICPYCGKTLRRRQVYKKKIQWLCSTYIEKGVNLSDFGIDGIKEPFEVPHDAADQQLFQPVREPVGEKIHKPSLEQARQQGDQRGSQKDDAAASHELLHALAFGTWVVRSIALQQIDNAPHAKSSAEGYNKSLQSINSGSEKLHRASFSPGYSRP